MSDRYAAQRCALIALPLILLFVSPVFSQGPPGGAPPVDRSMNAERARQQDMSSREWQLRNFGNESKLAKDKRTVEALMKQTEEDFTRILTLHNEIARALAAKDKPLNNQFVSETTAEIKKRASRVQSSLALGLSPQEAEEMAKAGAPKELPIKDELVVLCNRIRSFVTNPSIENPNTINVEQMSKARKDLETVIQLSERINKSTKN